MPQEVSPPQRPAPCHASQPSLVSRDANDEQESNGNLSDTLSAENLIFFSF